MGFQPSLTHQRKRYAAKFRSYFRHSQELPVGYSKERVKSICYIIYELSAQLRGTDLPKYQATVVGHIFFWPNRQTTLPDDPLPRAHYQKISIPHVTALKPFEKDERSFPRRLKEKITFQSPKTDVIDIVAHIPRYNMLGEPFEVGLSYSTVENTHDPPSLTLVSGAYLLYTTTSIGRSSTSRREITTNLILIRRKGNLDTAFPEDRQQIPLHTLAPFAPAIEAAWNSPRSVGQQLLGPICPTFQSTLIARSYRLGLEVTVSCERHKWMTHFEGGEIILLHPRLDPSIRRRSQAELGEDELLEAVGDLAHEIGAATQNPRTEVLGDYMLHEVEGENDHWRGLLSCGEMTDNSVQKESSELVGDAPMRAELTAKDQQQPIGEG